MSNSLVPGSSDSQRFVTQGLLPFSGEPGERWARAQPLGLKMVQHGRRMDQHVNQGALAVEKSPLSKACHNSINPRFLLSNQLHPTMQKVQNLSVPVGSSLGL